MGNFISVDKRLGIPYAIEIAYKNNNFVDNEEFDFVECPNTESVKKIISALPYIIIILSTSVFFTVQINNCSNC